MTKLGTAERNKYLNVIDRLRELGVASDISLPQLVVVGDQSSGKSSLLEGITNFTFPIDSDICTRFATQIILRRSAAENSFANVSILPGPSSVGDAETVAHLEKFKRSMKADDFDGDKVAEVLGEVTTHLGLPTIGTKLEAGVAPTKRFSDDIVRIEVSGPGRDHLSVVDVPGLFHNPTQFQTADDKDIIRGLVKKYIGDHRTIIMAVCSATSNLANQEVFNLAREADPKGTRTVGIVTKCDVVPAGDEGTPMDIALNIYEPLAHGWFAVKNRSTHDIKSGVTIQMRHEKEMHFFENQTPWSTLPRDRKGVQALAAYLGRLLSEHIRKEFPSLIKEIQAKRETALNEIRSLGDARANSNQQRQFLTTIASKYQKRVEDALSGNYWSPKGHGDSLKLRKHLCHLDDIFEDEMRREGHTYVFRTIDDKGDTDYMHDSSAGDSIFPSSSNPQKDIYEWIKDTYYECRGPELAGLIPPRVLEITFREQSVNWKDIANRYFDRTTERIQGFGKALLESLVSDTNVRENIGSYIQVHGEDAFQRARQHVIRFVADESENILKTTDPSFRKDVEDTRVKRTKHRLSKINLSDKDEEARESALIDATSGNNRDHQINEIHDYLKAYYKVALKRFMDNIANSVIESDLLGEGGPLKFFTPATVGGLSEDQLAGIAAETSLTAAKRAECTSRAERMHQALQAARGSMI